MENELSKALDKKFMNSAKFSLEIERIVIEERVKSEESTIRLKKNRNLVAME